MPAIRISADSTCDLSPEQLARYDIGIIPLYVSLGEQSMRDGVDITAQDIYDYVDKTGKLPKTAAPSVADYFDFSGNGRPRRKRCLFILPSARIFRALTRMPVLRRRSLKTSRSLIPATFPPGMAFAVIEAAVLAEQGVAQTILAHEER